MNWRDLLGKADGVSAWRTCFVANEFNEIQTFRRIHVSFHLLFVLFFLKVKPHLPLQYPFPNLFFQVINFENFATADTNYSLSSSVSNHTMEYNRVFRTGIAFPILLGTGIPSLSSTLHQFHHLAFLQFFFYVIFYQRLIEDKIINFIDLCSVSNISVFILDDNQHGYYIHGRSPHGTTDVNMRDMVMNLERESRALSGTRGLEANSSEQLFILKINRPLRIQYELLFNQYSVKDFNRIVREEMNFFFYSRRVLFNEVEDELMPNSTRIFYFNPIRI